jgi:hypothetical protein
MNRELAVAKPLGRRLFAAGDVEHLVEQRAAAPSSVSVSAMIPLTSRSMLSAICRAWLLPVI